MIGKLALASLLPGLALGQYSATYFPDNLPKTTEEGQFGTNQCGTGSSQDSMCQNVYMNGIDDFCLFAPPSTTSSFGDSSLGNTERIVVSWCLKSGYGTRLIPAGAITAAHFVKTPTYVQLSGTLAVSGGNSPLNIPAADDGGELDPHGADGLGNPIGGLVFSNAFGGGLKQIHEWNSFIGSGYFCFKACNDVEGAALQCQHIYDVLGCGFNMPGEYGSGFSSCQGDSIEYPGVYGSSTFHQGEPSTPAPHAPAATSQCSSMDNLPYNGAAAVVTAAVSLTTSASSATSSGMSSTQSSSSASSTGSTSSSTSGSSSSSSTSSTSSESSSSGVSSSSASSSMSTSARPISTTAGIVASTSRATSAQSPAASASSTSGASQNAVVGFSLALAGVFGIAISAF